MPKKVQAKLPITSLQQFGPEITLVLDADYVDDRDSPLAAEPDDPRTQGFQQIYVVTADVLRVEKGIVAVLVIRDPENEPSSGSALSGSEIEVVQGSADRIKNRKPRILVRPEYVARGEIVMHV